MALRAAGLLLAASAGLAAELKCDGGACPALPRDHALLQMHSGAVEAVGRVVTDAPCGAQAVSRRRRWEAMTSCRRRHSSPGHQDTDVFGEPWTCDEVANEMRCAVAEQAGACAEPVSRRRRQEQMTSCRRRHSSPGHDDTDVFGDAWTCDEQANVMRCRGDLGAADTPVADSQQVTASGDGGVIGYAASGDVVGTKAAGLWCAVAVPASSWDLRHCPLAGRKTSVKMLTYNLFWWNLFNKHGGSDRSAGKLIAHSAGDEGFDLMAFQECDDRYRVLSDARAEGLRGDWDAVDGGRALALMYRKDRFAVLAQGKQDVGEDSQKQYYGKRAAHWVRLRHTDGTVVFFINHHGPLPVSESGGCTGSATAFNILKVTAENAHKGDAIILTGDFNAQPHSSRIKELNKRMHHIFAGHSMGGVDHIYSNCNQATVRKNLGKGHGQYGSDHDALTVTFHLR